MFLFKCCQEFNTGQGYQLERRSTPKDCTFVTSLKTVDTGELYNDQFNILKIKKSDYDELYHEFKDSKKKFIDQLFPACESSLGHIEGIQDSRWKRISEIIPNPVLFASTIEPSQVIQGNLGDCYFLSALAAIAEKEERVVSIFGEQTFNAAGIYKVPMLIDGEIEEIIVDDFIPVNDVGEPLFCQPNKNQFWVLILEKAWAKVHGSYANIVMGTPTEVLRTFTFAPSEMVTVKQKNDEREKLWTKISEYTAQSYPICCTTAEDVGKGSLSPGHSYTLLACALLEDTEGVHHKLMKLRDPWGKSGWDGLASEKDRAFWSKIVSNNERRQFERKLDSNNFGVFYITYNDFCDRFKQIHYCLLSKNANYISEPVFCDKKHGKLFEVDVLKKGIYCFCVHQSEITDLKEEERREEGICRTTLLLIKNNGKGDFDFIEGILKYNEQNTSLTETLEQGSYILFVKVDPTRGRRLLPSKIMLSVYSTNFTTLESVERFKYPHLLKDVFLKHARNHKKNKYNNGFMWLSSKLFFHQGGYAYIAFGNEAGSNKKFVIDLSEEQFTKMNFKLKGEFKGAGNQKVEILPGEEKIFLARVRNQIIESLKFPPTLGIKMEMIQP